MHNKPIQNKLDAWLTFCSSNQPEKVCDLITAYPEFNPMYEELYRHCLNTERVMDMFSQEFYELDTNTVKYMMDEMQYEINDLQERNDDLQKQNVQIEKE